VPTPLSFLGHQDLLKSEQARRDVEADRGGDQRIAENPAYGAPVDPESRQPPTMNPLFPTKRSSTFFRLGRLPASRVPRPPARSCCPSVAAVVPRPRRMGPQCLTSIRMPWNGLVATLAFPAVFYPRARVNSIIEDLADDEVLKILSANSCALIFHGLLLNQGAMFVTGQLWQLAILMCVR
jgi:hypothetical protein